MIEPSLPTLLAYSTRQLQGIRNDENANDEKLIEFTTKMLGFMIEIDAYQRCDCGPFYLSNTMTHNGIPYYIIFFLFPWSLVKPRFQHFVPSMQTLYVCPHWPKNFGYFLPVLWSPFCDYCCKCLIFLLGPFAPNGGCPLFSWLSSHAWNQKCRRIRL